MVMPDQEERVVDRDQPVHDPGYCVLCWNDPVNTMGYVVHVFQVVFGWDKPRAERHMLEVHHQGKSLLVRETLERAEFYVHRLHQYGLQATLERDAP